MLKKFLISLIPSKEIIRNFKVNLYFKGIFWFWIDYLKYKNKKSKLFSLKFKNIYPIYFDRFESAGDIDRHYTYQDLWAAKKVYASKVKKHY